MQIVHNIYNVWVNRTLFLLNMLISLRVRNFLSIYDEVEFDFGAKKYGAKKDNLFDLNGHTLSKSNIIY